MISAGNSVGHIVRGKHLLADFYGVQAVHLQDCTALENLLREAANAANAHILFSHLHSFGPGQGITGVLLLAESHISIHTWPECRYAALDIFMCGQAEPELALRVLEHALQPSSSKLQTVQRG